MELILNQNRLFTKDGNEIIPDENGFCYIGKRKFVFPKLMEYIRLNNWESDIVIKSNKKVTKKRCKAAVKTIRKKYYYYIKRPKRPKDEINKHRRRPIIARKIDGSFERCFRSHTEAAKELNITRSNISLVLSGKRKHSGGYVFKSE